MSTSEIEAGDPIILAPMPIRNDPFIRELLAKLPGQSSVTFTDEQLVALKAALGGRSWGAHAIDLRWTLSFWRWHSYFVFLAGRNRRTITRREYEIRRLAVATLLITFGTISTLFGLLVLYLTTSALSFDQMPDFVASAWQWFRQGFL